MRMSLRRMPMIQQRLLVIVEIKGGRLRLSLIASAASLSFLTSP